MRVNTDPVLRTSMCYEYLHVADDVRLNRTFLVWHPLTCLVDPDAAFRASATLRDGPREALLEFFRTGTVPCNNKFILGLSANSEFAQRLVFALDYFRQAAPAVITDSVSPNTFFGDVIGGLLDR